MPCVLVSPAYVRRARVGAILIEIGDLVFSLIGFFMYTNLHVAEL